MSTTDITIPSVEADARQSFHAHTAGHQLTVLHDDGLYRHLRFADPDRRRSYWFDIITWPGHLTICGDMGSYLFGRSASDDMLAFFRGQNVNPGYWAQKAKAADPDGGIWRHSAAVFTRRVTEEAVYCEADFPGLTAAVATALADELLDPESAGQARQFLDDFEYRAPDGDRVFRFTDTWEWDLRDLGFHYAWCCHAIMWAVARYDAKETPE